MSGGPAATADSGASASDAGTPTTEDVVQPDGWFAISASLCEPKWPVVAWVADGDTIFLEGGSRVRFLGIDTPETSSNDCLAAEAKAFTTAALPKGATVCLVSDKKAGNKDMYNRLLRYVFIHKDGAVVMLNARLIRQGLARVYDQFAKGLVYEQVLRDAEDNASAAKAGGWSRCNW